MKQNCVKEKQNEPYSIDLLSAQRQYYLHAKWIVGFSLFFCVVVVASISIINRLHPSDILTKMVLLYSIVALGLGWLLAKSRNKKQNLAARIQHLFDTRLFGLKWDNALCGSEPCVEDIERGKLQNPKKLEDWYKDVPDDLPLEIVALVCMRMNVAYDQSMKRRLSMLIYIVFFIVLLLIIIANLQRSVLDFLVCFIAPMVPVFKFFYDAKQRVDNDNEKLIRLNAQIDSVMKKSLDGGGIETGDLQNINNLIFEHRNTSSLMPDWYYDLLRNKEEKTAEYSALYYYERFRETYARK